MVWLVVIAPGSRRPRALGGGVVEGDLHCAAVEQCVRLRVQQEVFVEQEGRAARLLHRKRTHAAKRTLHLLMLRLCPSQEPPRARQDPSWGLQQLGITDATASAARTGGGVPVEALGLPSC